MHKHNKITKNLQYQNKMFAVYLLYTLSRNTDSYNQVSVVIDCSSLLFVVSEIFFFLLQINSRFFF